MTIFTKIINGEIPCYKIYEDELVFAFLDINPINPGHTLIVPKVEVDKIYDLDESYYQAIFKAAKKISKAIESATKALRVCAWVEGFEVPHAHYHICPFYNESGEFWSKLGSPISKEEMLDMQTNVTKYLAII